MARENAKALGRILARREQDVLTQVIAALMSREIAEFYGIGLRGLGGTLEGAFDYLANPGRPDAAAYGLVSHYEVGTGTFWFTNEIAFDLPTGRSRCSAAISTRRRCPSRRRRPCCWVAERARCLGRAAARECGGAERAGAGFRRGGDGE